MSEMKIYRVQNKDGEGMYAASKTPIDDANERDASPNHPDPYSDSIFHTEQHFFGFSSKKQAAQWLSHLKKSLLLLEEYGFDLYEIEVKEEHVLVGGRQVAFVREEVISSKNLGINFVDFVEKYTKCQ